MAFRTEDAVNQTCHFKPIKAGQAYPLVALSSIVASF